MKGLLNGQYLDDNKIFLVSEFPDINQLVR